MQKEVEFQTEEFIPAWASKYPEKKFSVFSTCFLSTKKNSHELNISEDVLRRDAQTILGNFLVAKLQYGDSTSHMPDEIIYGYFPREQEIEFDESEEGIVKAKAYCVISKMYGNDFNDIFSNVNLRNTSVEMTVQLAEGDEHEVTGFDIFGLTCLGKTVRGSCPDAQMQMVRFTEQEAEDFYAMEKNFAEEEKYKNHPIDASKEAMYDGEWDGNQAKQDLVKEKNYESLAPKVCLRLEEGWKDRQVTKLGYPVMGLYDGKWVYFKKAIASALAYAKQENDEDIVNKVKKLYKKLDIEESRKEGESKMAEIEFAAVDISDMWSRIYEGLHAKYPDGEYGSVYYIDGIFEESESKQKFVIVRHKAEDNKYRLNFSFTEEGLVLADELVKVEIEIVETDEVRKFAEPEDAEKYKSFAEEKKEPEEKAEEEEAKLESTEKEENSAPEEKEANLEEEPEEQKAEMSADEMKAEMARLKSEIETRDNIIMEKDTKMGEMEIELAELRKFKQACMEAERAAKVEAVMNSVASYMDDASAEDYRAKGMACGFAEFDAWSNEVKAVAFEKMPENVKKAKADEEDIVRMSGVIDFSEPTPSTALERLKRRKH